MGFVDEKGVNMTCKYKKKKVRKNLLMWSKFGHSLCDDDRDEAPMIHS